jgi:hypothetical protein
MAPAASSDNIQPRGLYQTFGLKYMQFKVLWNFVVLA